MAEQSTPIADPTQQQAAAPGGESGATTTATTMQAPGATISMTREEHDRLLAEARRTGERSTQASDELKDLRAKAKRLEALEEASKSDLDKATERAARAEADKERLTGQFRTALIRSEFTRLAADQHLSAQQIADAFTLANTTEVTVSDDGAVVGVDKALAAVLKDRPYLTGQTTPTNGTQRAAPNITPGGSASGGMTREQAIEREKQALMGTGRYT